MRLTSLSRVVLALAAFTSLVEASSEEDLFEPAVSATAAWPENNPFGQIVNGERNRINLVVENNSELNVTLISVAGAFIDVDSDTLVKNISTIPYGLRLIAGTKLQVPYQFHSEFKPGDIHLNIWLTHMADDTTVYRVTAFDSIVTVVEPEVSIFDYQVVTTYLITAAFLGGLGYFAFLTFAPKTKKSRRPVSSNGGKQAISAPVGSVTASGAGGYEEEWIPEHHLKSRGGKKKTATSGDELSGGETSGTDGKKKKGRK